MVGLAVAEVFDSFSNQRVHSDLPAICNRTYAEDEMAADPPVRLQLRPVKQQVGGNDCGLFAVAIQDAILRGLDPTQLRFDQSAMRRHLADCFRANKMSAFPLL